MKKSLVYVLLIFILSFFIAGCTELKQDKKLSESQIIQKENKKEEHTLSANYYYLESRIHIKNKDYKKAIVSLEKAMVNDPDSFILTRDLSQLYLNQNNEKKALELAEKLVRQNPDNVDGLLFFVQLKKDAMDEKELVEILNKILMLDPDNKETFLRLAKIYIDKNNNPEALVLLKKMVGQFPDYYVAWFYLGEVYLAEKQYELAKIQYLKTIELEPDLVEPRFQLIKIFSLQNTLENNQKILETYKEILEIEPDNYRAQLGMALHYYKNEDKAAAATLFTELAQSVESDSRIVMMAVNEYISGKRPEDAVIVFSQMLKSDPENQTLNFFTGMAYEEIEDSKNAVFHYLKIKPDHSQYKKTILSIAFLYQKSGKNQEAINYLEDKYKTLPKDIDIIIYLASFYEKDKNYEKAISLLKTGLEDSPENTSLLFRLGAVQDSAGFKEDCISTMKKVIEIDPKDASALNYLGYSYADLGINLDEALLLIKRAHEIKPDDGYITDSLGWVYYKRGEYEEAVKYLEKAAQLTSFETIISDHLGDAYQKTNQFKKALDTYKKAVTNAKDGDKEKILELKKKIEAVKKKLND
ncbi:MAG: tetratricopeptide repeat protein [Proteobacteria bacterium]|nr:tetratricopeptide repeat protein [Pseudomonadota bacterium]